MSKFIALHSLYYSASHLMDLCVNADEIRTIETVYTDDPEYSKGVRSQIAFSDAHVITVIEPINEILLRIEEAK